MFPYRKIISVGIGLLSLLSGPLYCRAQQTSDSSMSGSREMLRRLAQLDSIAHPQPLDGGSEQMSFERTRIDVGNLNEDDGPSRHVFRWRNVGQEPLVLTRVVTSCGCAVPAYDRAPVLPGSTGQITVTYYPKGHPGHFQRKISVFTQLSARRPTAVLELSGHVIPSLRPTTAYPHVMGDLRLKQREISLEGTKLQVERIECLNGGLQRLRIWADTLLLPACLSVRIEPSTLEPGDRCDVVVRYDPDRVEGWRPQSLPVILRGLNLPPSQSTLQIRFTTTK